MAVMPPGGTDSIDDHPVDLARQDIPEERKVTTAQRRGGVGIGSLRDASGNPTAARRRRHRHRQVDRAARGRPDERRAGSGNAGDGSVPVGHLVDVNTGVCVRVRHDPVIATVRLTPRALLAHVTRPSPLVTRDRGTGRRTRTRGPTQLNHAASARPRPRGGLWRGCPFGPLPVDERECRRGSCLSVGVRPAI